MDSVDDRLDNWGRAYRLHRVGCRIMSVWRWARSGRFSASPDAPSRILDIADASLVEDAVRTLIPWRHRFVALHYAIQLHPGKVCYHVNRMEYGPPMVLRLSNYNAVLWTTQVMVGQALDKQARMGIIRSDNSTLHPAGGGLGADARPELPPNLLEIQVCRS